MNIPKTIPLLWAETETTHHTFRPELEDAYEPPLLKGGSNITFHAVTPLSLSEDVFTDDPAGSLAVRATHSWSPSVVLAMVRPTLVERLRSFFRGYMRLRPFEMRDAVIVVAKACERCLNVLAHEYGTTDGYAEGSEKWCRAGTRCRWCEGLPITVRNSESLPLYEPTYVHKSVPPADPVDDCHAPDEDMVVTEPAHDIPSR